MCWRERNSNRDAQYHPHLHLSTAPCLGPTLQQQKPTAPLQDLQLKNILQKALTPGQNRSTRNKGAEEYLKQMSQLYKRYSKILRTRLNSINKTLYAEKNNPVYNRQAVGNYIQYFYNVARKAYTCLYIGASDTHKLGSSLRPFNFYLYTLFMLPSENQRLKMFASVSVILSHLLLDASVAWQP